MLLTGEFISPVYIGSFHNPVQKRKGQGLKKAVKYSSTTTTSNTPNTRMEPRNMHDETSIKLQRTKRAHKADRAKNAGTIVSEIYQTLKSTAYLCQYERGQHGV
jgi:hypothetical protein